MIIDITHNENIQTLNKLTRELQRLDFCCDARIGTDIDR